MKFALAQLNPFTGNIERNVSVHLRAIERAIVDQSHLIVFPELSLTGYEPAMAKALAVDIGDTRLDVFQNISDRSGISIAIGAPTKSGDGICISLIVFRPHLPRRVISKKYLHPDEDLFFIPGEEATTLQIGDTNVAFAICYEISIDKHLEELMFGRPKLYVASVAKFGRAMDKTLERLEDVAEKYSLTVAMANAIGPADGDVCAGGSLVIEPMSKIMIQLTSDEEAVLVYDTLSKSSNLIKLANA